MEHSVKRCKNLDLIITMVFVVINVAWVQVANRPVIVSTVFALPLIFFLPGYALTQILFRRHQPEQTLDSSNSFIHYSPRSRRPIGRVDQILLSFGLSIAMDIVVGFVLNFFPIGLQGPSWVLSLGLVTTIFLVGTTRLRCKDRPMIATRPQIHITLQDCVLCGLAISVVASTIWLAIVRPLQPQPSFTLFWMLPVNRVSEPCTVTMGVQSFEMTSKTYRMVMRVNSTQTNTWSSIVLVPQQKWIRSVHITPDKARLLFIEAQLYRSDKPATVYRNAHLTFYTSSVNENEHLRQQCMLRAQK